MITKRETPQFGVQGSRLRALKDTPRGVHEGEGNLGSILDKKYVTTS